MNLLLEKTCVHTTRDTHRNLSPKKTLTQQVPPTCRLRVGLFLIRPNSSLLDLKCMESPLGSFLKFYFWFSSPKIWVLFWKRILVRVADWDVHRPSQSEILTCKGLGRSNEMTIRISRINPHILIFWKKK